MRFVICIAALLGGALLGVAAAAPARASSPSSSSGGNNGALPLPPFYVCGCADNAASCNACDDEPRAAGTCFKMTNACTGVALDRWAKIDFAGSGNAEQFEFSVFTAAGCDASALETKYGPSALDTCWPGLNSRLTRTKVQLPTVQTCGCGGATSCETCGAKMAVHTCVPLTNLCGGQSLNLFGRLTPSTTDKFSMRVYATAADCSAGGTPTQVWGPATLNTCTAANVQFSTSGFQAPTGGGGAASAAAPRCTGAAAAAAALVALVVALAL